jgi:hypothetical protein
VIADGYDTKLTVLKLIPLVSSFEKNSLAERYIIQGINRTHQYSKKKWDYYSSENRSYNLALEWVTKLDPILQRAYVEQGQVDQVENTSVLHKTLVLIN